MPPNFGIDPGVSPGTLRPTRGERAGAMSFARAIPHHWKGFVVKKLLPLLGLLAGCTPDITQDPAPSDVIVVQFDPGAAQPVVPLPNDLAMDQTTGKIVVPPSPTDSAAQKEFNEKYLGTLDGFPYESTASVKVSGELKAETVNPKTVQVFDITLPTAPTPVEIVPRVSGTTISIPPPLPGNWTRAHHYAVVLVGGPNGLRGAKNQDVIGSQTWTLVSSRRPLVTCTDLKTDCAPTVDIIPSSKTDPAERLADQTANAIKLERLRRAYAPLLDGLARAPLSLDRSVVPIVWTFTILNSGEMTFDPANNVIPFPNDVVRTGPGGTVALPNPTTGKPLVAADCLTTDPRTLLTCGLNTLDGFSTTVPPISENSDKDGALSQGSIDPKSLDKTTVGLVPLKTDAPPGERTAPKYTPCLNCTSSRDDTGKEQTLPQQLQWKLDAPLDEKTTYFAFVTTGVKEPGGKPVIATPVFALVRSSASLLDGTKSTVNILSDEQAARLEPLRLAFKPAFDALQAKSIPREALALAFPFTTQSEATVLDQLYAVPAAAIAKGLPDFPVGPGGVKDVTALYKGTAGAVGIPVNAISKFYSGVILTPVAVTGPSGTFQPGLAGTQLQPVLFAMAVPAGPTPSGGYPVTIFGHGFTRSRNDFLPIANSLAAAGQVTIATDVLFHGERTSCTGSKAATMQVSDDASCADPATMMCDGGALQGLCVLRAGTRNACAPSMTDPLGDGACAVAGQGRCAADGKCQGAGATLARDAGGRPKISGWNIFSLTNFFATRDRLRQQVIDLSQLVSVLKSTNGMKLGNQIALVNGGVPLTLDTSKMGYVGQSLGGIMGTLFNSVSPDTTNVVLNVPGGSLVSIILTAPSFVAQKKAILDTIGAPPLNLKPGTPGFDQFIGVAQWILDPADPVNMAYRLTHSVDVAGKPTPNVNRKAFIQFIEGDQTVPNPSTLALIAGANRDFVPTPPRFGCGTTDISKGLFCYEFTEAGDAFDATTAPPTSRHGFLLSPPAGSRGPALTSKAQTQAATFLAIGALP